MAQQLARLATPFDAKSSHKYSVAPGQRSYVQQYSHVYNKRAAALRGELEKAARKAFPGVKVVGRVVQAAEAKGDQRLVVLGTTFKACSQRPDVIEGNRELFGAKAAPPSSLAAPDDDIVLEDESGRLKLLKVDSRTLVTGLPVACVGKNTQTGFEVERLVGCGFRKPQSSPMESDGAKVLLIGGLAYSGEDRATELKAMARFALLTDWLGGRLSDDDEFTRRIARCFCVGDVVCLDPAAAKGRERTARALDNKNGDQEDKHTVLAPVRAADVRLARLASLLPTACLPGARDPTSFALPQQPLHPLLLPEANRYSTFTSLTNPAEAAVGGRSLLAHAGQPVTDFLRSASYEQGGAERVMGDGAKCTQRHVDGDADDAFLACLEDTLWWRHAAPTAPDTLPSYPFKDGDPFVLEDPPDVLVSGAAPAFATSLASTKAGEACARLVCLPSFAETGVCAVLDLETLAVERLCFDDGMDEDAPSPPPASA
jgi:DNA polymerase delta subunit 2